MSIVNMFTFDHMPARYNLLRSHMVAEGFDLFDAFYSSTVVGLSRINERTWFVPTQAFYYQSSSAVTRYGHLVYNRRADEMFGLPQAMKLGVIGFRVWVDQTHITNFITNGNNGSILQVNSAEASPALLRALNTPGEHFVEFEFDFVSNTVKTYLNATLIGTFTPYQAMGAGTTITIGLQTVMRQDTPTFNPFGINDIYITHDNGDGDVSGRLGPVKVLPLTVDKTTRPANWGYQDLDAFFAYSDYDAGGGATYTGHCLVPRYTEVTDFPGQFKYTSVPQSGQPGLAGKFSPPSGSNDTWAVANANSVITHNFAFTRPKKVTAYVIAVYAGATGAHDSWTFEGSADGTAWTVLDTRSAMAVALNQVPIKPLAFKLAAGKVGSYRYYRIVATKQLIGISSPANIYLTHLQLLGDPADAVENGLLDGLSRAPASNLIDLDYPVIRTGIDSSEGTFGFAVPEFGTAQVLAVKVGLTGRRDQASSEHIRAKLNVGASNGTEKVFELKSHTERHEMFPLVTKAPDGTAWTKENLAKLQVVVKSKSGAK